MNTKSSKRNYEDIKKYIESENYIIITTEQELKEQQKIQNKTPLRTKFTIRDDLGFYYYIEFSSFQSGKRPAIAHKSNPYTIQNIKLWCELNDKPFTLMSTNYENNNIKLLWQCLKDGCGEIFKSNLDKIYSGRGCSYCRGLKVGVSNCIATKNPELSKEWHQTKNGKLTPYDVTCGSHKKVWWKCEECGNEWCSSIKDRNKGVGCSQCKKSKGEKRVEKYFIINGLIKDKDYISQKEFNGLLGLGGKNLSYDFYLPKHNLLIEYQGEFHDGSSGAYAKKELTKQQEHDKRKYEYAKNHNINLLEIWYWDFDRIEEILHKELNLKGSDL